MDKFKLKMVKLLKIDPVDSFQVLPNNRLNKDFQKIVYSLNYALSVFLNSKYNIRNHHIYSAGKISRILSFCCMLSMNMCCIYRIVIVDIRDVNKNMSSTEEVFFSLFTKGYFIVFMIGFTITFILNIVHKNDHIVLILKLQSIHESIDFSKSFIVWNWISVLTVIVINNFIYILYFTTCHYPDITDLIVDILTGTLFIGMEINLVTNTRILILLRKYLYGWIKEVIIMNDDHENNERILKLFETYQSIMKAYNLYKKIFQAWVSSRILYLIRNIMPYLVP